MPTQKQILKDRLRDTIDKKVKSRSKHAPKAKSTPGKENRAAKAVRSGKGKAKKDKVVKKAPAIQWAKAANHPLTDQLLTIIEDSSRYRQAFGFSKEPGTNPTTGGQTLADLYTEVADQLLVSNDELDFTEDDLPELQKVVSNRVSALKKLYRDNRQELGETGQGLVDSEMTEEIEAGTALAHVWDRIKAKFPWYERLNKLVGSNPAIDRTAIANSETFVDTGILDARPKGFFFLRSNLNILSHPQKRTRNKPSHTKAAPSDDSSSSSESESESEAGANGNDSDGGGGDDDDDDKSSDVPSRKSSPAPAPIHTPRRTPGQGKTNSVPEPPSTLRGSKRKASVMEQITEMANVDRSQRLKIVEVKQKEKTRRSRAKNATQNDLELARMKHQECESALQRQHDLAVMERQLELERIRSSAHQGFAPGPYYHGQGQGPAQAAYGGPHGGGQVPGGPGPAYGGPPAQAIDPTLGRW